MDCLVLLFKLEKVLPAGTDSSSLVGEMNRYNPKIIKFNYRDAPRYAREASHKEGAR
jgi:hypothetical protein